MTVVGQEVNLPAFKIPEGQAGGRLILGLSRRSYVTDGIAQDADLGMTFRTTHFSFSFLVWFSSDSDRRALTAERSPTLLWKSSLYAPFLTLSFIRNSYLTFIPSLRIIVSISITYAIQSYADSGFLFGTFLGRKCLTLRNGSLR